MRVLVCGSRDFPYEHKHVIEATLNGLLMAHSEPEEPFVVIQGGATGADSMAREWAVVRRAVEMIEFKADWEKYGKKAGFVRNELMLKKGKPDIVWGFTHKGLHQSRGTRHMLAIAREAGVATMLTRV